MSICTRAQALSVCISICTRAQALSVCMSICTQTQALSAYTPQQVSSDEIGIGEDERRCLNEAAACNIQNCWIRILSVQATHLLLPLWGQTVTDRQGKHQQKFKDNKVEPPLPGKY